MHPLLFPLGSQKRWYAFLESELKWSETQLAYAKTLLSKDLIPLSDGSELSTYLGLSSKIVQFIRLYPEKFYRTFTIPKKNGSARTIQAPRLYIKVIQHYILDCILSSTPVSASCFGFRRGVKSADGALIHAGCNFLWNIDIKDFFPSITRERVIQAFCELGYNRESSVFLSAICCLDGRLPQGAPTSPMLSNFVFFETDKKIQDICGDFDVKYSRYADDLSFSTAVPLQLEFCAKIRSVVEGDGFVIHPEKNRMMGPMCRREVTGLTVNEIVSIPRHKRRIIRSMFHKVSLNPEGFVAKRSQLAGIAGWVSQHHPEIGKVYLDLVHLIPQPTVQEEDDLSG